MASSTETGMGYLHENAPLARMQGTHMAFVFWFQRFWKASNTKLIKMGSMMAKAMDESFQKNKSFMMESQVMVVGHT